MKRAALLALLLAACSKGGDDPSPAPAEPPPAPSAPAPAPQPTTAIPAPSTPSPPTPAPAPPAPDAEDEARKAADLLLASGDGDGSGMMSKTPPGGNLDKQVKEIDDSKVGVGVRVGDPRPGTCYYGPCTKPKPSPEPPAKYSRVTIAGVMTTNTPANHMVNSPVVNKIRSVYAGSLQYCAKQSTHTGKVSVDFNVNEKGRSSFVEVSGAPDSLKECVIAKVRNWMFSPIKDEDGEATDFDVKLRLVFTLSD